MTKEEINRSVAEEVMGECWHEFDVDMQSVNDKNQLLEYCPNCENYFLETDEEPDYSTSWDAMRLVVERMREFGYWYTVHYNPLTKKHTVRFYCEEGHKVGENSSEELPLACSLAALEAVRRK